MKRDASALIIVLWVIALLSVLIGGFAFDMHLESRIVSYQRKKLKSIYLAKAGIEYSKALLARSASIQGNTDTDETKAKPWYSDAKRLRQGYAVVGLTDQLGEGTIVLDLVPEPALRNINKLRDDDWERIFQAGGVPEKLWEELIDSFNDWRDADDQANLSGAESDYYSRLEPPYKARGRDGKEASLDTIDELLLIKGFTHAILHGGPLDDGDTNSTPITGIADLLTANKDSSEQVNVNAASKRVLMTLPGIDETIADAIIEAREGLTAGAKIGDDYFFKDANDFFGRVPALGTIAPEDQQYLRSLAGTASTIYRITSVGRSHGVEYKIVSVIVIKR
jgi:type II secretory pathway component PulK